jgi:hypothetical protein
MSTNLRPDPSPARDDEQPASEELGACRKLRSKLAFLPLRTADNEPLHWERGDGSTAVYWCLRTMECGGPDGGFAHGSLCRHGRDCFEPLTS